MANSKNFTQLEHEAIPNPGQVTINKLIFVNALCWDLSQGGNTWSGSNNGAQLPKMKAELESWLNSQEIEDTRLTQTSRL